MTTSLHQLPNCLALRQHGNRTTGVVDECVVGVDAEVAIDGGQHVAGSGGTLGRVLAFAVGGADDLAGAQAAAGEQDRNSVASSPSPRGNGNHSGQVIVASRQPF